MSSRLAAVSRGKVVKPHRIIVYGQAGLGKSTFAAGAPNPIFLDVEGGSNELDVERVPGLSSFDDVLSTLDELLNTGHGWKTIVVDGLDALEALAHKALCTKYQTDSIEKVDGGYGRGYVESLNLFRKMTIRLDLLREKGMGTILIAHSGVRTFTGPDTPPFDRYDLKLNKQVTSHLCGWADAVLFARYEVLTTKDKGQNKAKGIASGERILCTQYSAAFEAKNRYGLPPTLPLEYGAYKSARLEAAANAVKPEQ